MTYGEGCDRCGDPEPGAVWSDGVETLCETCYARAEATRLRGVLGDVLDHFTEPGHPGRPCLRTDWVTVEQVDLWRENTRVLGRRRNEHG